MAALSRRAFIAQTSLACGCGSVAALAGASGARCEEGTALRVPSHDQVALLEGPLRDQFDHQQALFLGLDNDALLKPFRQRSGLPAPGADMGGWYDNSPDFHVVVGDPRVDFHGFIPGHSFGQYVSGLARGYAAGRDVRVQAKLRTLVGGYSETISPKFFDDYNLPAYTFDKLTVGLIDAYAYAGVAAAKPGPCTP